MIQLDRTLTYRLHLLHKLADIESQRAYVAGAGLSMSDGRCLTAVGTFAPLSVNELAKKANLNKGQASRAAQSLVDQGLVPPLHRRQGDRKARAQGGGLQRAVHRQPAGALNTRQT